MTAIGALVLVLGALAVTSVAMYIVEVPRLSSWAIGWAAATIGGFVASVGGELFVDAGLLGPRYEGLFLVPALLGASLFAAVVAWLATPASISASRQAAPQGP